MHLKRKWIIRGAILLPLFFSPFLYDGLFYALATYQYEKLVARKPSLKPDVERLLFLYSARKIDAKDSLWANGIALATGDSCWQYKILWRDPIDVVYDTQDRVKYIFPSFE